MNKPIPTHTDANTSWTMLVAEASAAAKAEPHLATFFRAHVLQHDSLAAAISHILSQRLQGEAIAATTLEALFLDTLARHPDTVEAIVLDLHAIRQRDCACQHLYQPLCFFKGFHALCAHRIMHLLWTGGHQPLALLLQSRSASVFDIDIHPAAHIGHGVMLDHGTGIVIGETASVGDNVSIMQGVTLGGTGKESGDRHPKIGNGVLISVSAIILGNIRIGDGAQIAAGSVVLDPVAPHTTVAGVPAKVVGKPHSAAPALDMDHSI